VCIFCSIITYKINTATASVPPDRIKYGIVEKYLERLIVLIVLFWLRCAIAK